jgi:hypothetical protein
MIAASFKEGEKLGSLKHSFFNRLYVKNENSEPINTKITFKNQEDFSKTVGLSAEVFPKADIMYLTQNHFDEYSSNPDRLYRHLIELVFEKYADEKYTFEAIDRRIAQHDQDIQEINLSIQHLLDETKGKKEKNKES